MKQIYIYMQRTKWIHDAILGYMLMLGQGMCTNLNNIYCVQVVEFERARSLCTVLLAPAGLACSFLLFSDTQPDIQTPTQQQILSREVGAGLVGN